MFEKEQSYIIKQVDIWRSIVSVTEAMKVWPETGEWCVPVHRSGLRGWDIPGAALRCVGVGRTLQPVSPASWTAQVPPPDTLTSHSIRRTKSEPEHRTLWKCFCWMNKWQMVLGVFSRASVTKPHRLDSLNNSKVLLHGTGGLKHRMPVCFPDPWAACLLPMTSQGLFAVCAASKNLCLWKSKKNPSKQQPETESHLCHPGLQFTL